MTQVGIRDAAGRFIETFEIFAKLPGPGSLTSINVRHATTVGELKSLIELVCGIPSELQMLSYRHHTVLTDGDTLGRLCVLPGARLLVKITYGYDGLVDAALRGDLKEVLRKVAMTMDADGMSRRRFVAMFIAAHKGYYYLVDRMLCDGAHPDSQTPSGRTALHVACAMGNSGCIDSLLQHGASLDIRDATRKTPADTAASCGQQGAQRRVVLYARILSNKATKEKPCGWSMSPKFPKSKLGSSVTPTISLKDLAITPGPELMITAWHGRKHHHHYFERTHRPQSAKSAHISLFQSDSATSSTESWGSFRDKSRINANESTTGTEDTSIPHQEKYDGEPMSRSVHIHDRHCSALSSNTRHKAESAPPNSVKFASDRTRSTNIDKYSEYNTRQNVPVPSDSYRYTTLTALHNAHSPFRSEQFDVDDQQSCLRMTHVNDKHDEMSTCRKNERKDAYTRGNAHRETLQFVHEIALTKDETDESSSNNSNHSSQEAISREVSDMKINYQNDKLRDMIDLPVEHPQRLDFMREATEKLHRTPSPNTCRGKTMTRKPTPEENEQAFNDWLASKTQDARDRKLVNSVQTMLDDAFGKKDETLIFEDDDQALTRTPLTFQAWAEKKSNKNKLHANKLAAETAKREPKEKLEATARLNGGKSLESWLANKVKKQRQERQAAKQKEDEKQQIKADHEKAAQDVFKKWSMQKEWEELQMLKQRPHSSPKRRPKSGNKRKVQSVHQTSTRRIRAHSAPPRRLRNGLSYS